MSEHDLLRIDPDRPAELALSRIVSVLETGGVVAFPTDTLYGLGALALSPAAVERVRVLKGYRRPRPFVILFDGSDTWLDRLARVESAETRTLLAALWPGPVTVVLPAAAETPSHLVSARGGVALRTPAHALSIAIVRSLGRPIVSTSANAAGEDPIGEPATIRRAFGDGLSLVVDGGELRGTASTLVDATAPRAVLVRRGRDALEVERLLSAG